MTIKRLLENLIRGWLPKETSLPSNQTVSAFNVLKRLELVRLAYSVMLGALLVTPFGVYHSISEPYITGYLWGYDLPIGYIGLLLGIVVVLYPRVSLLKSRRFSSLMPVIGLFLLLTLIFSPNYYFINLQHGTSFSASQIDIDFQLGNSAVVIFSLLSLALGLASAAILRYEKANKQSIGGVENMNTHNHIRGWLPKESNLAYMQKAAKPRWRRPHWIAFMLIGTVAVASIAFLGVRTYIRYSDPQADVTAAYYEKSLNASIARAGDIVEVKVLVGWHGYILPEFKRQVRIIDPFPESNFKLVGGNNTYQYSGHGGGDQFKYLLKVTNGDNAPIELPKPRLYLDNTEIPLTGTTTSLGITTFSEQER